MSFLPNIDQARSLLVDPASSWRWIVALPTDIASGISTSYSYQSGGVSYDSDGLTLSPMVPFGRCENVQLAGITINTDPRFTAASHTHYPRFLETENFTASFYEDHNYNTLMYFRAWRERIVDKYHNYYPSSNYKRTVYFFAFDGVSSDTPRFTLEMMECFPTNPGAGLTFELNTSQAVTIPITFSVDDVEMHWNPSN